MRHKKAGKKLGRTSAHRETLYANLVTSLLEHERIETTDVKAKIVRRLAERTITWGVRVGDLTSKDPSALADEERALIVHSMRMAQRMVRHPDTLQKVMRELGPRYLGRRGGYTRVTKVRIRLGDAAPISMVELIPGEGQGEGKKGETKHGGAKDAKRDVKQK
jgi:large subunit ribosomal protein L17